MVKDAEVSRSLAVRYAFYLLNLSVFILLLMPALSADISLWWLDQSAAAVVLTGDSINTNKYPIYAQFYTALCSFIFNDNRL